MEVERIKELFYIKNSLSKSKFTFFSKKLLKFFDRPPFSFLNKLKIIAMHQTYCKKVRYFMKIKSKLFLNADVSCREHCFIIKLLLIAVEN